MADGEENPTCRSARHVVALPKATFYAESFRGPVCPDVNQFVKTVSGIGNVPLVIFHQRHLTSWRFLSE